jgi:hypothetical protein
VVEGIRVYWWPLRTSAEHCWRRNQQHNIIMKPVIFLKMKSTYYDLLDHNLVCADIRYRRRVHVRQNSEKCFFRFY